MCIRDRPILYGWKKGRSHKWFSDRSQKTVSEFDRPLKSENHPTMKPLDLLIYLIKNSSKYLDKVFDGFLGSGSTLIACERTLRINWLNPRFSLGNFSTELKEYLAVSSPKARQACKVVLADVNPNTTF